MGNNEQDYFWQDQLANGHTLIGLNEKGQEEIGTAAFVDFAPNLKNVQLGDPLVAIEGSKVVTQFDTPLAGKVVQINQDLLEHPENLNSSDHQATWIVELAEE
ncbi:glycine cleavage system protein H [Bombilactobacillus thymidiniphilus]|uniref:Glycine cleavage system protein H n=1 Tax=Bombilactobacillus thymidiniphilus TaxID=2923363 RepID=A0ABY4PCD8_9LACO|nr:glycine cleavage system protein H [Bombilactobacillus thymidiniphilus]UQS83176.1 glycine cleavage system protein H [Bombilactobacillus thymidiniphilus]